MSATWPIYDFHCDRRSDMQHTGQRRPDEHSESEFKVFVRQPVQSMTNSGNSISTVEEGNCSLARPSLGCAV